MGHIVLKPLGNGYLQSGPLRLALVMAPRVQVTGGGCWSADQGGSQLRIEPLRMSGNSRREGDTE